MFNKFEKDKPQAYSINNVNIDLPQDQIENALQFIGEGPTANLLARTICNMKVQGMTNTEISNEIGISVKTVNKVVNQIKKQLAKQARMTDPWYYIGESVEFSNLSKKIALKIAMDENESTMQRLSALNTATFAEKAKNDMLKKSGAFDQTMKEVYDLEQSKKREVGDREDSANSLKEILRMAIEGKDLKLDNNGNTIKESINHSEVDDLGFEL